MGKYWRFWSEKRVYAWLHGGPQRIHGENVFTYLRGLIATGIMVFWFYGFMVLWYKGRMLEEG